MMTIRELKPGQSARIRAVGGEGSLRQHFLDMGLIPGTEITMIRSATFGDPVELRIRSYELTLRLADAARIPVEPITTETSVKESVRVPLSRTEHSRLGEEQHIRVRADESPLPEHTVLTFALAGNQNCGKTTLFNRLTGSDQHVGNFPGVTVDKKSGPIRGYPGTEVTDLPGIYSLSPYTSEEIVSRQLILEEHPGAVINIADATNLERNLYLTMQLIELDIPMVLALNMMDEVRGNGGEVLVNEMEELLGIPVVPISAAKNEGIEELVRRAVHAAKYRERPRRQEFCDFTENGGALHRCIHEIMRLIGDQAKDSDIPVRFAAMKLIEGDPLVRKALHPDPDEEERIEQILRQTETEIGQDRSTAVAAMRFSFIRHLTEAAVISPRESREHRRSRRIDRVLTGKYTAVPAFLLIMVTIFYLTFHVIGAWMQELLERGIGWMSDALYGKLIEWDVSEAVCSLVTDGICAGVGSVLGFLPVILVLFFFLSMLEDTGYMARAAFVMDQPLQKLGLTGKSIVPLLIGFGCTVPGVMAARTMPSERDRKMTILLTPFMSCSAKLPIYGFLAGAFFPGYSGLVTAGLYLFGIVTGILLALIEKKTVFRGKADPFVMELPNYRMPGFKNVFRLLRNKAKDFIQRAFTVIFSASVVIWFLQNFDLYLSMTSDPRNSILARTAGLIAPIFVPLGFGCWQVTAALITGFLAKESVVATLTVLFAKEQLSAVLSPASALPLLVFCLLYTPCAAAIAAIRRELGGRWAAAVVFGQCAAAWVCAFAVRTVCIFGEHMSSSDMPNLPTVLALAVILIPVIAVAAVYQRRKPRNCGDCRKCGGVCPYRESRGQDRSE